MKQNFEPSLAVSLSYEGGYTADKRDPGNWTEGKVGAGILRGTKYGISAAAHPTLNIKALTIADVGPIYKKKYWDAVSGDKLAAGVDLATFDAGIMSGPSRALKWLMASIGGSDADTVKKLCGKRLGFVQTLKIWQTFKNGWLARITSVEAKGVAWAVAASGAPVKPKLEAAKTAATKSANKNMTGAAGAGTATTAGGGEAVINPQNVDAVAGWVLGGLLVAGVALAAFLVIRAIIHKQRAAAYAAEAAAVEAV